MKKLILSIFALLSTASWAQDVPTLKLINTYTPEPIMASLNFGGDIAIYNDMAYISAWNNSARFINFYSIQNDGSLALKDQIVNPNNQFGWSVAASDNYLAATAASAKQLIIHPLNGKSEYSLNVPYAASNVALDGNTLILGVKGQIEIFSVSDTKLTSLCALSEEETSTISGIGTKPAIKGDIAAINDRTNARVIIFERVNGSWSQTAMITIPDATANLFGLTIGDGHIFSADRGTGYIYDIAKQNGTWSISQTIKDGEGTTLGSFLAYDNGYLLAICNAGTKDINNSYVFKRNSKGIWTKAFVIKNNEDLKLGSVAAISGNNIYISNYNASINDYKNVGAVFHYRLDTTEDNTPIMVIKADSDSNNEVYDLQGRKINGTPAKGLFIRNGKLISIR